MEESIAVVSTQKRVCYVERVMTSISQLHCDREANTAITVNWLHVVRASPPTCDILCRSSLLLRDRDLAPELAQRVGAGSESYCCINSPASESVFSRWAVCFLAHTLEDTSHQPRPHKLTLKWKCNVLPPHDLVPVPCILNLSTYVT